MGSLNLNFAYLCECLSLMDPFANMCNYQKSNDEANDGNEIGPDETRQLREDVARLQQQIAEALARREHLREEGRRNEAELERIRRQINRK